MIPMFEHMRSVYGTPVELEQVLLTIKSGTHYTKVLEARTEFQANGKSERYEALKHAAVCVKFPSDGLSKTKGNTGKSTGLMYIDADSVELPFDVLHNLPKYFIAYWRSYSGAGFGMLAQVDGLNDKNYAAAYQYLSTIVANSTGVECDPACATFNRINFLSYDPEIEILAKEGREVLTLPHWIRIFDPEEAVKHSSKFARFNSDPSNISLVHSALTSRGWVELTGGRWRRPGKPSGHSALWSNSGQYAGKFHCFTSSDSSIPEGHYDIYDMHTLLFGKPQLSEPAIVNGATKANKTPKESTDNGPKTDVFSPETNEVDFLVKEASERVATTEVPSLDLSGLPDHFVSIITSMASKNKGSLEFYFTTAIATLAAATMNRLQLKINSQWTESPVFWVACLGPAGIGKTPHMKPIVAPFVAVENLAIGANMKAMEKYEQDLAAHEALGRIDKGNEPKPKPPKAKNMMATQATIEAILDMLTNNNGCLYYHRDELKGFFGDLNAYRGGKGSDKEAFLSAWSLSSIFRRTKSGSQNITNPFLNIASSGVLSDIVGFYKDGNAQSGLYERFLYAIPNSPIYEPIDLTANTDVETTTFNGIFSKIHNFFEKLDPVRELMFDNETKPLLNAMFRTMADARKRYDTTNQESKSSVIAKLQTIFLRLIIMCWLIRVFTSYDKHYLDYDSLYLVLPVDFLAAQKLLKYYEGTAMHMHALIHDEADPTTLDRIGLSKYRKNLLKIMLSIKPNCQINVLTLALNKATSFGPELPYGTVGAWVSEIRKTK